ncbi:MAG: hypothetical protein KDB40_19680 [Acidimicrobiales bacterium]|nr:hypothetical protein [Acidimicrobiales bacterium]MCB9392735.1 hypothetical protein [Acidimicrobiaceae bacterium]
MKSDTSDAAGARDDNDQVRDTLSCMYGAVAALVREDRIGMEVLLDDLRRTCTDPTELLATMAFATLDRLDAALTTGTQLSPRETRALAQRLLTDAHRFALVDAIPVQAAARRLDAVRRHDHGLVAAEVMHARTAASDPELLFGAVALLAATVNIWAERSNRSLHKAIGDLCLAASVEPVG